MRSYTLHLPPEARPGEALGLDRAVLVRDGFSWGAFVFTVLWFFYHRLWLAGLGVLVGLGAAIAAMAFLGLAPGATSLILLLLSLLVGLEASSLRRWTLARRGRPARDAVLARDAAEAEAKALERWLRRVPAERKPLPSAPSGGRGEGAVIGLFPFGEAGR